MLDSTRKPEASESILDSKKSNAAGRKGLVLLIVGIIILIAVIVFLVLIIFSSSAAKTSWSAVFLTNGRTYFGNIVKQNSNRVVLRNVYYLQVQQNTPAEEGQPPQSQVSLVGISDEFHLPESEMEITRAHILFIERLRKDSQVVATIEQMLNR